MSETKLIYHLEGEDTPFLIKIAKEPTQIKLADIKTAISQNSSPTHTKYKYLFKTLDEESEIICKTEVINNDQNIPLFENRVICWLKPIKNAVSSRINNSVDSHQNNTNTNINESSIIPNQPNLDSNILVSSSTPYNNNNDSGNGSSNSHHNRREHLSGNNVDNSTNENRETINTIEKLSSATKNLSIVKTSSTLNTTEVDNGNEESTPNNIRKNKPKPPPRNSTQNNLNESANKNSNNNHNLPAPELEKNDQINKITTKKYFSNLKRFPSDTTLDSTMTEEFGHMNMAQKKSLENEFFDDGSSRYSTMTTSTNFDSKNRRKKTQGRRKQHQNQSGGLHRHSKMTDSVSTFSSMTDSTVSLNIVLATLDMTRYDTLGITLISDQNGGPVLVGYVFPTGAVAADGRIERGDIIIEINGVSVEDKATEEAVEIIRKEAKNPINGMITMTVAKQPLFPSEAEVVARTMQGNNLNGLESDVNRQPSVPISCEQWVKSSQTQQPNMHGLYHPFTGSTTSIETSSDTLASSVPDGTSDQWTQFGFYHGGPQRLTLNTPMMQVVSQMTQRNSGLEIKDRQWLKIHIPRACLGSELVDWLFNHVEGLEDRRNARRYGATLLKAGFIRHTIEKVNFSEQCYYCFADPVSQQNAQRELLKHNSQLPAPLHHLRYGATHLAHDAMSLISESSCASTIKEFGATPKLSNGSGNKIKGFSPANSISPSAAYQSGWNPAPSAAQQLWANRPGPGSVMSDDSQSIISMSSSISQQHLKIARDKMAKRQQKKLSKSATVQSSRSGQNHSGSSNSSDQSKKHKKDKSSYSDGNKSNKENIGDNQSELSFASTISTNSKKLLPQNKPLGYQPAEITASRLSFQYAMANPMPSPMTGPNKLSQPVQPMGIQNSQSLTIGSMQPPMSIPGYNTMSHGLNSISALSTPNSIITSAYNGKISSSHLTSGNPLHVDMPNPPSIESLKKLAKQKSGQGIHLQHMGLPRQSTVNNIVQ